MPAGVNSECFFLEGALGGRAAQIWSRELQKCGGQLKKQAVVRENPTGVEKIKFF